MASGVSVAIIGGGVTGATVAISLMDAGYAGTITIIEPRAAIGGGLAYANAGAVHRINVPASRMSLYADKADHFAQWLAAASGALAADPDAVVDGRVFALRADFGRYVAEEFALHLASGQVRHIRDRVALVRESDEGWLIRTSSGSSIEADLVVIASSHPPPALPKSLQPYHYHPRVIPDALQPGALDTIGTDERVLIVGAGLTALDVVASLDAMGAEGKIALVSRRGLRPRGHTDGDFEPYGTFADRPFFSASALLRDVRKTVAEARAQGIPWQAVIDAVRAQGQNIWCGLTVVERRRIVRHLRAVWDVHRFRAAPQTLSVVEHKLADGSLEHIAAHLQSVEPVGEGFRVTLKPRHGHDSQVIEVDRIIVTTGPAHHAILQTEPYLADLAARGQIAPDAVGLGIATSETGRAIGADGDTRPRLFIAGPLARGTFGELMGLPQVTDYARFISHEILDHAAARTQQASLPEHHPV